MTDFLYIAHYFPPIANVESKINYTTAEIFKKHRFNPIVISSEYNKSLLDDLGYTDEFLTFRYNFRETNRYIGYARKILRIPEYPFALFPHKPILKIAEKIIKEYDIKFIYGVFGRGVEHIAARELKRKYKLPLVLEFQDPITNNKILQKYIDDNSFRFYGDFLKRQFAQKEKEIITSADIILVETPSHKLYLEKKYMVNNVYLNLLGFNRRFIEEASRDKIIEFPHKPVIGFIGSTYHGCEEICLNFMHALKRLEKDNIDFTFISTENTFFSTFENEINLKNHVPLMRVGYGKALKYMNSLDIGLVLIPLNYPENINSKMFEYIALKKLVVGIVPEEGDMAKIIRENNLGVVLPYTENEMYLSLKNFIINSNKNKLQINEKIISKFEREKTFENIIDRIKEVLK